jgi:hypothetical protein
MNARRTPWESLGIALIAVVGIVDSLIGRSADLTVLFAVSLLLAVVALVRSVATRRRIALRADLVAWLEQTALAEGTTVEAVADSALSAARAGMTPTGTAPR